MALYYIVHQNGNGLAAALIAASLFDVLDGWAARKIGVAGPLGKQLDSLSDAISFGATAGFMWAGILNTIGFIEQPYAIIMGALITAASVLRLGRFNLDESQTIDFKGMPTPANALFALGIWAYFNQPDHWQWSFDLSDANHQVLTGVLVVFWLLSLLWLNASFPVMSLKEGGDKRRKWVQYALVVVGAVLFKFYGALSISFIVLLLPIIGLLVKKPTKTIE